MKKSSPEQLVTSEQDVDTVTEANFSVSLSSKIPLQLTLTKTSLELLKSLAKVFPVHPLGY